MSRAVYNLPELAFDSVPPAQSSGAWAQIRDLDALASDLKLGDAELRPRDIRSIPDPWAQMQLFGQALLSGSTDVDAVVRADWRGLLALLALQPSFEHIYTLTLDEIDLEEATGNLRWRQTLTRLLPRATVDTSQSWRHLALLVLNPKVRGDPVTVGMITPATLVASGRNGVSIDIDLPWLGPDGFRDPCRVADLTRDHFAILALFLDEVRAWVDRLTPPAQFLDLRSRLIVELFDFAKDCKERSRGAQKLKETIIPHDWGKKHDFYAPLLRTAIVNEAEIPSGTTECRLRLRPLTSMTEHLARHIILADPAISRSCNRPPTEIRLWGKYMLQTAEDPAMLTKIRAEAAQAGDLIVTPDDLLTRRMVRFSDKSVAVAHDALASDFLLPLSPLALLFGDADALRQMSTVKPAGRGFEFSFDISLETDKGQPLQAKDGEPIAHALRRVYDGDRLRAMPGPRDLSLWPDFENDNWRWNFLRYQYNPTAELNVRFAASAAMLVQAIRGRAKDASGKADGLSAWTSQGCALDAELKAMTFSEMKGVAPELRDGTGLSDALPNVLARFTFERSRDNVGEQHLLPLGAEAIFFALEVKGTFEAAGCVLVARHRPIDNSGQRARIAVDFGSTNTIAYAQTAANREALSFEKRLHRPVRVADETDQLRTQSAAYADFFPPQAHRSPFPTILKRRSFGAGGGGYPDEAAAAAVPGTRHMIFFRPGGTKTETTSILSWLDGGLLVSDIKWSSDTQGRELTARFLSQTVIMCLAEMASRGFRNADVDWLFSYPQAFDARRKSQFKAVVTNAVHTIAGSNAAIEWRTESEAAAAYFLSAGSGKAASRLLVMLDIGGSTTDIAIRLDKDQIWRGSIRIAGRAFFTNYITANPTLLEHVDRSVVEGLERFREDPEARNVKLLELLLGNEAFVRAMNDRYPYDSDTDEWSGLRRCVHVAIGGMLYYIGMVLRGLIKRNEFPGLEEAMGEIKIAFGGRGSNSLRHLEEADQLLPLLRMLSCGAGLTPDATKLLWSFSEQPKHEVALGLLEAATGDAGIVSTYVPLGEPIDLRPPDERRLQPLDGLSELLSSAPMANFEPVEILKFLRALREETKVSIRLDSSAGNGGGLGIVRTQTDMQLRDQRKKAAADDQAEDELVAPFLLALEKLIGLLSQSAESRARNLSASG